MASVDVKKVLQLKQQLKESAEGHTLLKILKKLQELDITLDILAETGIGKVVNSFRKHDYAGEVAKSLIYRWKKLVPKDPASVMPPPIPPLKEQSKSELQQTDQEEKEQASASMSSSEREPKNEITGFDWKPSKKANGLSKWQPALDKPKSEADMFTGQRLNKKMQVYSGSKAVYLPTMMSLYQQCIRTLQNNIDSLYEIGGVPFEILEPVLERCTPEQLLRIEECNPVRSVTDHLWERHCCKDFRNARLEEYESWREMYLRLFEERDRKLQQLTKSIVLAHSGKPKGRQVKMAFIHSAAKPPRNVRIQQELHGTASAVLPYPTDKPRSVLTLMVVVLS
uniref:Elongin A, like n=1 Tax=Astyanax mexicanus TaxID=7994 RepID=A0A8B9JTQ9_ASTMX